MPGAGQGGDKGRYKGRLPGDKRKRGGATQGLAVKTVFIPLVLWFPFKIFPLYPVCNVYT